MSGRRLGPPTSTIESLVAETVPNNPELKFYEAEIAAARAGRQTTGLLANPELGAEVGRKSATDYPDIHHRHRH